MPLYVLTYEVEVSIMSEADNFLQANAQAEVEIKACLGQHSINSISILDDKCWDDEQSSGES